MSQNIDQISHNKRKLLIILGAFGLGVVFVASSSVVLNGIQSSRLPNIDVLAEKSARTQAVPKEVTTAKTDQEKIKETPEISEVELSDEAPVEAQTDQRNESDVIKTESVTNETDTRATDESVLETPPANEGYTSLREQGDLEFQADDTPKIETSNSAEETSNLNSSAPKRLHPVTGETRPETESGKLDTQVPEGDKTPETQSEPD